MNKTLIGIAAAVALIGTPALAADMPLKAPTPLVAAPYDWTGLYGGVHAGAGWLTSGYVEEEEVASGAGWLGGVQVGGNWQWRQWVIGVEGEFWGSTLYDRSFSGDPGGSENRTVNNRWDAAVSVRSGIAFDRTLIYGKLGVVWGKFNYSETEIDINGGSSFYESANAISTGVLLGVGFEYALTDHWTTKLEYNYIDYGTVIANFTEVDCAPCFSRSFSASEKNVKQLIKLGMNYKF
jgi:outer membrane immunogenic protein